MTERAKPSGEVVAPLSAGQHRAGAAAIAAGHADYPSFRHLFPDPRRRARALRAFFSATVHDAIPFGAVLAAWHGSLVAATAVWLPPGRFPWSIRRKLAAMPALSRVLVADPRAFRTFMRYGANIERAQPTEPHWYLEVLSVRPEHQRHGLGSRLVTPILERADPDQVPCDLGNTGAVCPDCLRTRYIPALRVAGQVPELLLVALGQRGDVPELPIQHAGATLPFEADVRIA